MFIFIKNEYYLGILQKRKQNKLQILCKEEVNTRQWVFLTSMGLFFLPTLFVWSFSGCGGALLTGGLRQGSGHEERQRSEAPVTELPSPALQEEMSGTLSKSEPPLWCSLDCGLYILISSKAQRWKGNTRPLIHFSFFAIYFTM